MKNKFIIILLLFCNPIFAQEVLQNKVDSLVNLYLKKYSSALVLGIYDNEHKKIMYYGETEKGNYQPPDSNSIFEAGNITETFTDILYADLSIKGVIGIDDNLQKYLPADVPLSVYQEVICKPGERNPDLSPSQNVENAFISLQFTPYTCMPDSTFRPQPVLLCFLGSHTSGLPEFPDNLNRKKNKENPYGYYNQDMLYDFLRSYIPGKIAGTEYKHSELGIALLGHVLALKMKKSYDSLLTEKILIPLNMLSTGINLSGEQHKHFLDGHNSGGKVVQHWTYDILAPAGALRTTAPDMMKFLSANISIKKNYFTDLLNFTHNPRLELNDNKSGVKEIALGWKISSPGIDSKKIVWQNGQTGGFNSFIGFIETSHKGVFILSSCSADVSDIGFQILRVLESEF